MISFVYFNEVYLFVKPPSQARTLCDGNAVLSVCLSEAKSYRKCFRRSSATGVWSWQRGDIWLGDYPSPWHVELTAWRYLAGIGSRVRVSVSFQIFCRGMISRGGFTATGCQRAGTCCPPPPFPLGHIWDVMLVWRNCHSIVCHYNVLCMIIMVHNGTSSSSDQALILLGLALYLTSTFVSSAFMMLYIYLQKLCYILCFTF